MIMKAGLFTLLKDSTVILADVKLLLPRNPKSLKVHQISKGTYISSHKFKCRN